MKKIFLAILTGSIFCALTILTAEVKEKKGEDFLKINDNIQNEELRVELEDLREEFKIERKRIRDEYNNKIESIRENRKNEMRTIKNNFAERREMLMKQYIGKIRNKSKMRPSESINNAPEKMKIPKDKKKIQKQ